MAERWSDALAVAVLKVQNFTKKYAVNRHWAKNAKAYSSKGNKIMFINDATSFKKILQNYDSGVADSRQVEYTFELHRNAMKFYLENKDKQPDSATLNDAVTAIKESTGVELTSKQLSEILTLFPSERIKLAVYGLSDTEVREGMYNVACCYFAGCKAPSFGDDMDINRFIKHLQSQAVAMGYSCSALDAETTH